MHPFLPQILFLAFEFWSIFKRTKRTFSEIYWKIDYLQFLYCFECNYDVWWKWWLSTKTHQKRTKPKRAAKKWKQFKMNVWLRVTVHRMVLRVFALNRLLGLKLEFTLYRSLCATLVWQIALHVYVCLRVRAFKFFFRLPAQLKHFIKSKFRVSFHREQMRAWAKQHKECCTMWSFEPMLRNSHATSRIMVYTRILWPARSLRIHLWRFEIKSSWAIFDTSDLFVHDFFKHFMRNKALKSHFFKVFLVIYLNTEEMAFIFQHCYMSTISGVSSQFPHFTSIVIFVKAKLMSILWTLNSYSIAK